jgi:hypothetical protein
VKVDLPSGEWAVLRDYEDLTQREAIALAVAQRENIRVVSELTQRGYDEKDPETWHLPTEDENDAFQRYSDLAIVTMLKSWTLEDDLPTIETVRDLKVGIYNTLSEAASRAAIGLDFGADGSTDPKAPTGGSNESADSSQTPT